MAVSRLIFAASLLLSLAAIATADYYTPPSPPVYSPKPTLPSPAYKPPYVSKPDTKPPTVYTPPVAVPYVPKPTAKSPTVYTPPKPYMPKPEFTPAVEGHILCKSGYNTYPIQGAKVEVVCLVVDAFGIKKELVISSYATDAKGYFLVTFYGLTDKVKNIDACKVVLGSSPLPKCNVPTNVNKGVTGHPLPSSNCSNLPDKHLKLYHVGSFFYTPAAAPKPGY